MAAVQRLKLKQTPIDVWSVRERLVLASSVLRSGDQNWVSVSRAIKLFGEPNRPADWFSQKNCALQYSELLEKVETPKRKRGERGDLETPGESIVRKLTFERIEELKSLIAQHQQRFKAIKAEIDQVQSGEADDRLHEIWEEILEEKRKQEKDAENHQKWLVAREAAKQAAQVAWRSGKVLPIPRKVLNRRISSRQSLLHSEQSSEIEHGSESPPIDSHNLDSCGEDVISQDVGISLSISTPAATVSATTVTTVPSSTPSSSHHSPLLNTLLRSTSHVSQPTTPTTPKDISPRSQAPTSFPSSVANLLTTVLSGPPDHESPVSIPRPTITSPSQGAPTLLKLLDMPLGAPGKLPPLPIVTSIQTPPPVSTTSITNVVPSVITPMISSEEQILDVKPDVKATSTPVESVPEVIAAVSTEAFEEVQVKNEPVMEVLETVSTIEIEVKEEPSDLVVEVVELEEVQEFKTHDDCVDLQEEEVFTENVPTAEEDLPPEMATCITEEKVEEVPVTMEEQGEEGKGGDEKGVEEEATTEELLHPDIVEQVPDESETLTNEIELNTSSNLSDEEITPTLVAEEPPAPEFVGDQPDGGQDVMEEVKVEVVAPMATEPAPQAEEEEKEEIPALCEPVEKLATESPTSKASTESQIIPPISDDDDDGDDEEDSSTSEIGIRGLEFKTSRRGMERGRRRRGSRGRRGHGRMFFGRWSIPSLHDESTVEEKNDESGNETSDDRGKGQDIKNAALKDVAFRGIRNIRKKRDESDEQDKDEAEKSDNRPQKESKYDKEVIKKEDEASRIAEKKARDDIVIEGSGRESDDDNKEDTIGGRSLISTDSVPNSPASLSLCGDDPESVRDYKLWKKSIMLVWRAVANHKYANVFLHPVTEEMAPGYHSVVYRPMDLVTVKRNIENGVIKTTTEFQRDVMLMFQNAIMYNNSDHDVYKMANEMQKEVMEYIENFVATQLMVQSAGPPKALRRETRDHSQKKGDSLPDKPGSSSAIPQEGENKRKRLTSEGEGGKTKKRRTRADDP